uniref:Uncharacterized protein n=1 Tax=Erpetoichthys calabaricus TaxID=27687 RepID=A0A8C4X372_ERPCA
MAEAQLLRCHDEYSCTVCLDTLNDPVSLSCGHSFCLKCLNNLWDQSQVCSCPECGETFTTRPELHINTVLNKTIRNLKQNAMGPPPSQNYDGPGVMECHTCTRNKFRKHLELFCKTDETCICIICVMTGHKGHEVVKLETKRQEKQVSGLSIYQSIYVPTLTYGHELWVVTERTRSRIQAAEMSFLRRVRSSVIREGLRVEPLLLRIERSQMRWLGHLIRMPPGRLPGEVFRARPTGRRPRGRPWTRWRDYVSWLAWERLGILPEELEEVAGEREVWISSLVFFSLLSDFCSLTLDINTAHRELRLSEGSMKVTRERTEIKYPDHPDRFDYCPQGLCMEALSGARCYWEVECSGDNMLIGVAYKGLSRKGEGRECSLGFNDKSWCLQCFNSQYFVYHDSQQTAVSISYCPKLGVYLDWSAGSLSFYSVSHTMTLLHRFNTSFTEPLYPGIGLDYNCSVTICHLTPVQVLFVFVVL